MGKNISTQEDRKWIQFGKQSRKLFHDIVSPLTSLCLGIEEMERIVSHMGNGAETEKLKGALELQNKSRLKIIKICRKIGFNLDIRDPAKNKK